MNDFDVIAAVLGGAVLVVGLLSKQLARGPVPPTLAAFAVGVAIGPGMLNVLNLEAMGDRAALLTDAARLALGIGLIGVALRVPGEFARRNWRSLLTLTGLGMPMMWLTTALLVYLILDLPFWLAALIGAVVTPTDPVAATPIVTRQLAEENVPEHLRHLVSYDSGANDGLAYLFVFLSFLMLTQPGDEALRHWLLNTLLWEIGAATLLGGLIGYTCGKLLQFAESRDLIDSDWRLVYTVALALLAIGAGRLIHSDEVLLVFAAGVAFDQVVSGPDRENEEQGQEAVNRFFAIPIFIVLGAGIPWDGWLALGWNGVLLAVAVLFLRRPLTILILAPLLRRTLHRDWAMRDTMFVGWFGPIAVSAMYYASLMQQKLGEPLIWHVASLIACVSVVAHGVTAAAMTKRYGRLRRQRA